MADRTSLPETREPLAYRPLSGLAVAGFGLAVLFAIVVAVFGVDAFSQGSPFFLVSWLFALPIAGAILGYLGQNQIYQSEGTRAGLKLARWAMGLSAVLGLVCATSSLVTSLALRQQADSFLSGAAEPDSGFFRHLLAAEGGRNLVELNTAFLLTMPPSRRAGADPRDERRMAKQFDETDDKENAGPLWAFRSHAFVQLLLISDPAQIQIEPLGVLDWKYENRSYQLTRFYRMTTPDGTVEFPMRVQSSEGSQGEQRRWFTDPLPNSSPEVTKFTWNKQGQAIEAVWKLSLNFLKQTASLEQIREQVFDKAPKALAWKSKDAFNIQLAPRDFPLAKRNGGRLVFLNDFKAGVKPEAKQPGNIVFGKFQVRTAEPFDPATATISPTWEVQGIELQKIFFTRAK